MRYKAVLGKDIPKNTNFAVISVIFSIAKNSEIEANKGGTDGWYWTPWSLQSVQEIINNKYWVIIKTNELDKNEWGEIAP